MGTIECPVCTLYLRADMSLEDHLETHPKEKVIQALVSMAMKPKAAAAAAVPQAPAPQPQQLEVVRSRTPPNALMYHHTGNSNSNSSGGYEHIQQPPQQHHHQQPMMAAPTAIAVVKASDMGGYPINNVMIVKSCSTKYVQQIPSGSNVANATAAYTSGPIDGRSIFIEPDRGGGGGGAVSTVRRQLGAPGPTLYPPRYTNERYSGPPPPYSTAISSTISSGSQSSGYGSKYQAEQKPPPPQAQAFYPNPPPPIVQTTPTIAHQHHFYATAPPPPPPPPPPPMTATMQHQQPSTSSGIFKGGHVPRNTLQAQYTEKDDGNFVVTENPKKVVEYTENDEGDFMVIEKIIKSPPRIIQIVDEVVSTSPSKEKVCEEEEQEQDELVQQREDREDSEYEMEIEEQYQMEEVQKGKLEDEQQQQLETIQIVENEDGTFDDNQQYGLKEMPKPMLIGGIGGSPKKCHKFNFIVEPTASSSAGSSATGSPYTPRKKPTSGLKVLSNVKVTTDLSQGIKDIILNLNCKNKGVNVTGGSSGTSEATGTSSGVGSLKSSLITGVVNNNCQNELIINNMPPIDLNDVNDIEIINDDEEDLRPGEDEECYIGSMEVKAAEVPAPTTPTPSVITSVIRMTPHPSPVVAPPSPPPLPAKLETIDPEPVEPPKPTSEVTITKPTPRKPAPQHATPSTSTGSLFHKPPKKLTVKLKTPLPPAPPPTPPLIPTSSLKQEVQPMDLEQPSTSEDCKPHAYFVPVESATNATPETKFCPPDDHPQISSPQPTTLTLTECSSTEVSRNGPLETIAVTTTTTKIEQQDAMQISETIVYTQSSSPEAAAEHHPQSGPSPGPSGVVETTTTSVEYYNITIIEDEAAAAAAAAQGHSSSVEQLSEEVDCVKPEVEQPEQKVALYEMKIAEYEPEREPDSPGSGSSGCDEPETKSCIKVEKMEVMEGSSSAVAPIDESEKKVLVAKVEPVSTADTSGEYQRDDHKDFLEAGPSRTVTTVDGEGSSSNSSSAIASSSQAVVVSSAGPTFLEYSAEYDDYVPVTSYGMPQEQIPLSWVQKFSPQYTPFDDQNSYMDLDQTDSKTNSNSVGGNSSATSSGGSGSRIETSMDRAPSAESLNIRTDEKMPAKGEISEQESNGDMELSWNRLYPVHENIPIYPSSYDLSTAQECWNLSNRSSTVTGLNQDHPHQGQQHQQQQLYHHHLSSSSSSSHHRQQHQQQPHGHQHGISFQFSSHEQPQHEDDEDGLVDDKSKIHLNYGGASGSGTNNYLGLGASSSGGVADHHKLAHKVRTYRCTECPKSFALLKQRRAHMQAEHHEAVVDSKLNVLATAASAVAASASATVTSGAFFSNPGEGSSGMAASGTTTTTAATLLSKKIKIEPQPVLMSYSSLKQELEQKQEGVSGLDMAGPSTSGLGSSGLGGSGGEVRRKRTYVCGTCKQEFDRFKLFNAHLMTHPAECYTCGRSFKHWPNFALHIKRHLGIKDHQCRLCGKKFVIKQKLIEHMRVHTGKAPIKCPDCDQHFRRFSNLAQHRNRHHLNKVPSKKDFVCHCGEVFQSKAKMEWHKEIHENKPKSCPFCREKFIHKNSLTRHIRLSHTEKYVKLETATEMCTICNQPYIKTSMKRHMETHTDERLAYSCTICNKLFSTNWNLKQHKWTHANPTLKPFQCNLCSSGFVREADYITHMNSHKSIRPYTCNHCGCQFIRKYNWIRHTREHETEKLYTCEICNRKFHRKYYLTEHKRIHTGERPFSCNICGKTSSTKTNHNKHIKIHHARDPLTAEG